MPPQVEQIERTADPFLSISATSDSTLAGMTNAPDWLEDPPIPHYFDQTVASAARVYDYLLGGASNFEVDRQMARNLEESVPNIRFMCRENRHLVLRLSRSFAQQGYVQFLDIGCGIPKTGSVVDVVRQYQPEARIVCVDNEAVACAYGTAMLKDDPLAAMVAGDVRDLSTFMDRPETQRLLDFGKPVVLILAALLHFIPDNQNPARVMANLREQVSTGSRAIVTHGTLPISKVDSVVGLYSTSTNSANPRTREQIEKLFDRWHMDMPLDWAPLVLPDGPPTTEDGELSNVFATTLTAV